MNIWDIAIIAAVVLVAALGVVRARRKKGSCCGDCAACRARCADDQQP